MNHENIIRMARLVRDGGHWNQLDLINFAALVAAAERERIIQFLREMQRVVGDAHNHYGVAAVRIKERV